MKPSQPDGSELVSRALGYPCARDGDDYRHRHHHTDNESAAHIVRISEVESKSVRWTWRDWIPEGKVVVLDGDPGLGKSTLMLDIAARISSGREMPDGTVGDLAGPAGVVVLSAEDGLADTIRPRLEVVGADLERVVALRGVKTKGGERLPTVRDVHAIWDAISMVDARLVIVDPLMAYLGQDVNSHRDQDVRTALSELASLAEETEVAIVVIRHLNKALGRNPLYRGGGSIGIIGAARAGMLVAPDPDDPLGPRRILASTKSNLGPEPPALAFHIKEERGVACIDWEGASQHSARVLLAQPEDDEDRSALEAAKDFLREELAAGSLPSRDIKRDASDAGISWRTAERAKATLGVKARKVGSAWQWELPPANELGGVGGVGGLSENSPPHSDSGKSAKTAKGSVGDRPPWEMEGCQVPASISKR